MQTCTKLSCNVRIKNASGFTLVELMIIITIIATIAAIAIPGLMKSQRSSNERNAASSLKNLSSAEIDFYTNDRDTNGIKDFWTRDVSGLYSLCSIQSPEPIRLVELTLAAADSNPSGAGAAAASGVHVAISTYMRVSPKAGFWYVAMTTDPEGQPYQAATQGIPPLDQPWYNLTRFGFLCYPDTPTVAQYLYVLNENHVVYKRAIVSGVKPPGTLPPGTALVQSGVAGGSPVMRWPTDAQLKADYAKLD